MPPYPLHSQHDANALEGLHQLLLSLFASTEQFRRWTSFGDEGERIAAELPGDVAAPAVAIAAGLDALRRRGCIDRAFFNRLTREFPGRAADIAHSATIWEKCEEIKSSRPGADLDVQAYLRRLLPEVDYIHITGIHSGPGVPRDILRRPIEELYTPLCSHHPHGGGEIVDPARREQVELPELLWAHNRLLVEGNPGSGKTTFVNLVACMLARDLAAEKPPPTGASSWREKYLGLAGRALIPCVVRVGHLAALLSRYPPDARGDSRRWLMHVLAMRTCPDEQFELDVRDPAHARRCGRWDELLSAGDAFMLLDGLDEVSNSDLRARILLVIRDASIAWKNSPFVITSRPIQTDPILQLGFHRATIEPLDEQKIEQFITRWADAMPEESRGRRASAAALIAAIRERPELHELAANPVMLTCLCVVHWNEDGLPDGRTRVYQAVFHCLLRSRAELRTSAGYSNDFAAHALPVLALAMMQGPSGRRARIDIWDAAVALEAEVARAFPAESNYRLWAYRWLMYECEWSHLVEDVDRNELKFWHGTMQEYAAALALARRRDGDVDTDLDWWPIVREGLKSLHWQEMLEFLPCCLHDEGGRTRVDILVERILSDGERGGLPEAARSVSVLGRVLSSLRGYKYRLPPHLADRLRALQEHALAVFAAPAPTLSAQLRVTTAEALGEAGFPSPPQGFLALPGKGVALARFPITVAEFAAFMAAGGYTDDFCWDLEGRRLRRQYGWAEPAGWATQKGRPNRPITGVSWCEARAYCRWTQRHLGRNIRLPLVAEWEFAASPDGREFPWGDEPPTAEHANFCKMVNSPSPVGIFPAGAGAFGHEELSGNVWEWCDDGDPEPDVAFRKDYGDRHWLKGGSWYNDHPRALTATSRNWGWSWFRVDYVGFRLVVVGP